MPESAPLAAILPPDAYGKWQSSASAAASWIAGRIARPGRKSEQPSLPAEPQHVRLQPTT